MVTDQQREARNAADRAKRLAEKEKAREKAEKEYKKSKGQLKNAKDYLTELKRKYRNAPTAKLKRKINEQEEKVNNAQAKTDRLKGEWEATINRVEHLLNFRARREQREREREQRERETATTAAALATAAPATAPASTFAEAKAGKPPLASLPTPKRNGAIAAINDYTLMQATGREDAFFP